MWLQTLIYTQHVRVLQLLWCAYWAQEGFPDSAHCVPHGSVLSGFADGELCGVIAVDSLTWQPVRLLNLQLLFLATKSSAQTSEEAVFIYRGPECTHRHRSLDIHLHCAILQTITLVLIKLIKFCNSCMLWQQPVTFTLCVTFRAGKKNTFHQKDVVVKKKSQYPLMNKGILWHLHK